MATEPVSTGRILARRLVVALLLAAPLGLISVMSGCGDELPAGFSRKVVEIKDVPGVALKAAKKAIPGVDFKEAWSNLDKAGKLHSYEIRGRASNGKIREVRVSPTGEILEME
jgi:hypothetical protein